ncbi:DNA primase [Melioribacteraceae bacterium 4301-Me]|uniref:DNA primase n=1 Tax=Pyranulibacter aquaticus TaxID=3163344 RepID=UPI00359625AF
MRILESKIDEIRTAADIVDIISAYVQLKKRGKNFVGLCPFHSEKTPSFTVSSEKQIYKCFGCGASGNVFNFLMEFKNISFIEAVQEIAEQLGISVKYEKAPLAEQEYEVEELYEINLSAAKFFSDFLLKSNEGEIAREYLKKRNIKPQTQKIFGLGYAPNGWDNFLQFAKSNKINLQKAKLLGLIDTNERGEYYDKFRDRIIFPIFSPNGRVIAFGGRILESKENAAKYLNSPESQVYIKRRSLYGLYHSKEEIRKLDKAILVEGYFDLISLYQNGIKNVVASSGTSLTEEQVQLLSRFTKNIIVLFDADTAGQKASLRSIEILLKYDFDVKVVSLPSGEDPDSFVQNAGKGKFEEMISSAKNFLEYQALQYELAGMFEEPSEQTKAIRELVKTLSFINDELKRNLFIKSIAKKFNLREKLIETELNQILQMQKQKPSTVKQIPSERGVSGNNISFKIISKSNPYEKEMIRLIYSGNEEIVRFILENVDYNDFESHEYRKLASIVVENLNENKISPSVLIEKIEDDNLKDFVIKLLFEDEQISKKWDELSFNGKIEKDTLLYAENVVRGYKIFQIDEKIKLNNKLIEQASDEKDKINLLKKNKELLEAKRILNNKNSS